MKPKLLKKLSGRMRKLSSSDCSTRKSSLDSSDGLSSAGCLNDSYSSLRTVEENHRPALVSEKALQAEQNSPAKEQTAYLNDNAAASSIPINQVHAAVHQLPAPTAIPATQPVHQYTTSHHSSFIHSHYQNPQEFVYYPTYNTNGRATNFFEYPQVDEMMLVDPMSSPSITSSSAALVPPPATTSRPRPSSVAAPEEDSSILQARREAIEATAKLLGADHPDTLLAIQSMQKHCRSGAAPHLHISG
eukprot:CAMPEP_0181034726 /NCGR_PEP_ID=MMETSP1070-20121207/7959_1 /TAXON_ID=265543 /ORGANISM="Minutocellus polymorphus, Strain NH13" /LENGTH=245 /DNA_ID=CAMNT_0023112269 /DNA_START=64 /DNA_END=801 /DNA_ORIENTATION=+